MMQYRDKWAIGGFDGHGLTSVIGYAKVNNISKERVVSKFPDTSAENLPKMLYAMNIYNSDITIVDIPINVKDPMGWKEVMSIIARNNKITIIDHHESNIKYMNILDELNVKLIQFSNTVDMSEMISNGDDDIFRFLLIGVTTDRDGNIKRVLSEDEIRRYLYIANRFDVLIRQNLSSVLSTLMDTPKERLLDRVTEMVQGIDYPPEKLISQVQVLRKYYNVHVIRLPSPQIIGGWVWKLLDQYMFVNTIDYVVGIGAVTDRQLNTTVPVVFVVKYWLSSSPSPLQQIRDIISSRKVIGHSDGFSVSCTSESDAETLASQIAERLTSPSNVVSLLPASSITTAIANDYKAILERLTQILEAQKQLYEQYLKLKEEQVNLLKQSTEENRRRYD